MNKQTIPARRVLATAEQINRQWGHENLGFLSRSHGFMPMTAPQTRLPASHRPWDEVAAQLPDLYRTMNLERMFCTLPLLPADKEHLPDESLLRASALLSILAHACARAKPDELATLPDAIRLPWRTVTDRLGRKAPVLSYIDLIVYNWRLLDAERADSMRVDNMCLLLPTVGNREEQIFYLTQTEMLAQCTPMVDASVRIQEAARRDDASALKQELATITDCLYAVTHGSFMQINPNACSASYVDPVVWAKTVAPFAVPIDEGVQGPSGTSSPIFHLLDIFFERRTYDSILGQESLHLRNWYPAHWRDFLAAVGQISVRDYVATKGDRELVGLYQEALNAYAGEDGFLGRHRLKVYGYLELAFKIGRSVTIGGFSGLFQDRTWDEVDDALEASRLEREHRALTGWHTVSSMGGEQLPQKAPSIAEQVGTRRLVLDVAKAGIRYRPGDRCCVLPENDPTLVTRTLRALQAKGDERVLLSQMWRRALALRKGYEQSSELALRDLLRFGRIRPLGRSVAKLLYRITANATLAQIIEARTEDQWELWDLLDLLSKEGFDPTVLWQSHPADRESICWIVPPESYRMYSIASTADAEGWASEIHLLAGQLRYETPETRVSRQEERRGTGSSFLARLAQMEQPQELSVKIVRPPRFHPPADPARPLVLFAGGTGIAPFRSFIHQRVCQTECGSIYLFYAVRTYSDFAFESELAQAVAAGTVQLNVAFSQDHG